MPQALPLTHRLSKTCFKNVNNDTIEAKFGDGYEQRADNGMNPIKDTWTIEYVPLIDSEATTVRNALIAVKSSDYFTWTPFKETTSKKFVVLKDSRKVAFDGEFTRISFQMREVLA